jgi:hypothetical protein
MVEFAIFWLPLFAGLLLGGLAVGAWYGGDRTIAVWVGFVGIICLLLTAALQIQEQVWRTSNQPKLDLIPSSGSSFLRWDPPQSYQMQISDQLTPKYGNWKVPVFHIRNVGSYAQDATVRWAAPPYEIRAVLDSSNRFQSQNFLLEENQLTLLPKPGVVGTPFTHPLEWSASLQIPFITREIDTFIPISVWETAAIFFIGTMPGQPNARSEAYFFDVEVKWNIPESNQPRLFRIKATAVNANAPGVSTPDFLAKIEFEVSSLK